jgi:predicted PurR-regulated permease PerM
MPRNSTGADTPRSGLWWRAAVLALGLLLALGLIGLVWLLAQPLALLLAAIVLSQALDPAIDWFERRVPRPAAVAVVYLLLVAVVGVIGWYSVPRLLTQVEEGLAEAPALVEQAQSTLEQWNPALGQGLRQTLGSSVGESATLLVELTVSIAAGVLATVLVIVMSVYWSIASPDLRHFSFSFVPERQRAATSSVIGEVLEPIGGYFRARGLVGLVVAVVTYLGLLIIGVEYPLVLALLAGFGELLPIVGPLVATTVALTVAVLDSPFQAGLVLLFYAVLQQVKSHVLTPLVAREHANIPPLLVIFAVLAGGSVGGIVGALVAPPLFGALRVLFLRVVVPPLSRWLSTGGLASG